MLKNKYFTFVRFGGLNCKKQKGYIKELKTYHSPPATKGIYAMPLVAQEFFLISSLGKFQESVISNKSEKLNQNNYTKKILQNIRKQFVKKEGYVWHHLDFKIDLNEVIKRNEFWVKTTIKYWNICFLKHLSVNKYDLTVIKKYPINYAKDYFEVFFDEKV